MSAWNCYKAFLKHSLFFHVNQTTNAVVDSMLLQKSKDWKINIETTIPNRVRCVRMLLPENNCLLLIMTCHIGLHSEHTRTSISHVLHPKEPYVARLFQH